MDDFSHTLWLFGLSGAGKSTLAKSLREALLARTAVRPIMLDGDRLRQGLCRGLGYSDSDRSENLRRASEVARLAVESRVPVIAAFMTPLEVQRDMVREMIGSKYVSFVYIKASLEICQGRDVKGLYARAQQGAVPHVSGLDSEFDDPRRCDLLLDTEKLSISVATDKLFDFAASRFCA